jgi:hypothetical protein
MAIPIYSNKPRFSTKQLSIEGTLNLPKFNAMTESSLENSSVNNVSDQLAAACGDPNLGTTFRRSVAHQAIYVGGKNIELNFFREMFPGTTTAQMMDTKRFWNHYISRTDLNIFAAATVTGTVAGDPLTFQALKQSHGSSGTLNIAATGYELWDKDNMIQYYITDVDYTIPYANKITIEPANKAVIAQIKVNTPYLMEMARRVGGESCTQPTPQMSTIGYSREVNFLRLRRDWKVTIDLLRSYRDKIQYPVIYDMDGNPMDSWDVYENMVARQGLQEALNLEMFIGSPTDNPALISGLGAVIDGDHRGFYGMLPTIKFGGGVVYDFPIDEGFDFEADGEPLFLWQDANKRSTKFLVKQGLGFDFTKNDRTNKMVARVQTGATMWEAYKRLGGLSGDQASDMAKLAIDSYKYRSFELDFSIWGALSDNAMLGTDYYRNLAIMIPVEGPTEGGRQINPMEVYQYGQNGWTGDYYETTVDMRKTQDMCENLEGYCAQSLAFTMHAPELFILLNPVQPS